MTISPQQSGTLTITVPIESAIDAAGNGNTAAEFSIEAVLTPLATNKLFDMQLKVSPNPATHFIRIEANQKIDSYQIINMNGKLIKQLDATDTEIAIGDLSPGVYFLQASSERHLQLVKFIKQ